MKDWKGDVPWGPTSSQGSASHALGPQGQGQDSQEVDFSSREGKTNCLPMGCASRWRVRAAPRGCTQTQNPRRSSHGTLRLWRWDSLSARQQPECSGIPATAPRPPPSCGSPVPLLRPRPRPPSSEVRRGEPQGLPWWSSG